MEMSSFKQYFLSKTLLPVFKWPTAPSSSYDMNGLLDPLSVIIVLATNSFKPVGTKLSINDGRVVLQDASFFQGTVRTFYGDNKTNVKSLRYPILYACKFYLSQAHAHQSTVAGQNMLQVFQKSRKGLEHLRHTYKEDLEIRACINSYINIIQSCLDCNENMMEFVERLIKLHLSELATDPSGTEEIISIKSHIFDEFKKTWDAHKIQLAVCLLRELDTATPAGLENMLGCVDMFLRCIHEKTRQVVDTIFTQK